MSCAHAWLSSLRASPTSSLPLLSHRRVFILLFLKLKAKRKKRATEQRARVCLELEVTPLFLASFHFIYQSFKSCLSFRSGFKPSAILLFVLLLGRTLGLPVAVAGLVTTFASPYIHCECRIL